MMVLSIFHLSSFLVVLAALNSIAFGLNITDDCLLDMCRMSSGNSSAISVSPKDAKSIKALLNLLPKPQSTSEDKFSCSKSDRDKYSGLIRCNCSETTCRVHYIDLSDMKLNGTLPEEIGDLTSVQFLNLNENNLSGLIPKSLVNLKELVGLDLGENKFQGPIPPFNGTHEKLEDLDLSNNRLNGSIPKELGQLPSLQSLYLHNNALTGTVPHEIWNIKTLQYFELDDNQIEGQLPELGNLTNLIYLSMMNNNFSGELPKSIGDLKNLVSLWIQGCNFNGTIPEGIYQLSNLELLMLLGNNFEGPFPKAFSSTNLSTIDIADIPGGEIGNPFPVLPSLTKLYHLTLRNCSLIGQIPPQIWQFPALQHLDLSFNKLTGSIPIGLNPSLEYIFLRSNKLNGVLPAWVYNSTGVYIDVSENNFTKNAIIPKEAISNDTNLFSCCFDPTNLKKSLPWLANTYHCEKETTDHLYINCGGDVTNLEGNQIYEADLDPRGTSSFVLSQDSSWGYSSMGTFSWSDVDIYIVNETCNIALEDAPLYTGARVAPVSLKYYAFCLKNDHYNVILEFAEIGWDPSKDDNFWGKRLFDIEIQGKRELTNFNIEEEAKGVHKNITKNFSTTVTENRLEIHLYWSGKGSMFHPIYYGPLISAISISAVPKEHHPISSASIGAIVGSSLIFVGLIVALLWMFGCKKPKKDGVELYPGGVFTFQELKAATNNFDSANKIGETGSVYRGTLINGAEVAVKKFSVKSKQEAHQLITEIGLTNALQHPNIAKILGSFLKETQVLLVYKYMENLSLEHALFGLDDEVRSKLNWRTRFKICLGMAKGLAFLHEESKLDIIHSNIKPTNILLDKDFNVKISDFRYSELHEGQVNEKDTTSRNVPRAKDTGHMAPEYMLGLSLTPKADVYSFGLVTFELISGQPLITSKPTEDIQLLNIAYKYFEEGILEALIDPNLREHKDYKHSEAVSILYLAMRCVSPSFDLRPAMSEVVEILEGRKKFKGKRIHHSPLLESGETTSQSIVSHQSISEEGSSTTNLNAKSENRKMEDSATTAD